MPALDVESFSPIFKLQAVPPSLLFAKDFSHLFAVLPTTSVGLLSGVLKIKTLCPSVDEKENRIFWNVLKNPFLGVC